MKAWGLVVVVAAALACASTSALACQKWNVGGAFVLLLNDGTTVVGNVQQTDRFVSGHANRRVVGRNRDKGQVHGEVAGNDVSFIIDWDLSGRVFYEGAIDQSGKATGVVTAQGVSNVQWSLNRHAKCML
jgi:hypothetical protein